MVNRVVLVGRLTKDPELKRTQTGKSVVSFTVAVNRRFGQQEQADFINCVAWQKKVPWFPWRGVFQQEHMMTVQVRKFMLPKLFQKAFNCLNLVQPLLKDPLQIHLIAHPDISRITITLAKMILRQVRHLIFQVMTCRSKKGDSPWLSKNNAQPAKKSVTSQKTMSQPLTIKILNY